MHRVRLLEARAQNGQPAAAGASAQRPAGGSSSRATHASANVSERGKQQRQRIAARKVLAMLSLMLDEDVPFIVNRVLLTLSIDMRAQLRELSALAQEPFLAKRE
eukprot:5765167-Pleurochrysis_carterae.AAC.3